MGRLRTFPAALPVASRTLGHHAACAAIPTYDRAALQPGVVHLSVGHFHRSHQAVYFDDLAQREVSAQWGVVGVGLRNRAMQAALVPQDGLYTVVERRPERDAARIVGVMGRYLFAPDDVEAVVALLADARTRLVTLTITAGAYHVDPATAAFDGAHPDVAADLASPARPRSALGLLVAALDRRRRAGRAPFTVLSCDNMPANGTVARTAVASFAGLRDERLARWIEDHVAFPSSMVDRITPKTTAADRRRLAARFGIADRWPVTTEPFSQWIVEDAFSDGRPPLEEAGVRFVGDVRPYALTKTRLLNATHCALGHLGSLAGHRRTDEAMADPVLRGYAEQLMTAEIAPLLPGVVGLRLPDYTRTLLARLANPKTVDTLARLCRNGSAKVPCHVLPSIAAARARGADHPLLTLAVAGWLRHLDGRDDRGRELVIDDPLAHRLRTLLAAGRGDPRLVLEEPALFGALADDAGFVCDLRRALRALERDGARAAVRAGLATQPLAA
jgi:fructuronate reductase/mannitol 2-dehydrogenase